MPRFSPPSIKDTMLTIAPWALAVGFALAAHSGWYCLGHNHDTTRVEIIASDGAEAAVKPKAAKKAKPAKAKTCAAKHLETLLDHTVRVSETHTVPAGLVKMLYAKPQLIGDSGTARAVERGFKVEKTVKKGVIRRLGLRDHDIITHVEGRPLRSIDDLMAAAEAVRDASEVNITIIRQGVKIEKRYVIE